MNKRLCGSADDIVNFNSGIETNTTGEFLITKVMVNKNVSMPNTIMIINVYRSPSSNANKFLELLEENLNLLRNQGRKTIILAGDFNIDLINCCYFNSIIIITIDLNKLISVKLVLNT